MTKFGVLSWDWKDQVDVDALDRVLFAVTDGAVRARRAATGDDDIAVVVSAGALSDADADRAYQQWLRAGPADVVELDGTAS